MSSVSELLSANALLSESLNQAHGDISSLLTARDELSAAVRAASTALALALSSTRDYNNADAALMAQRSAVLKEDRAVLRLQRRRLEHALARLA